jgi:hypothetical protein
LDRLKLDGIAMPANPIPCKSPTTGADLSSKDITLNESLHDCAKLTNLSWDCTTIMIHLPRLTENGEWIYCSPDQAGINESMDNMFINIPEALSLPPTSSIVRLTPPQPPCLCWYTKSYYEVSSMQSIELTGESKKRFRYFYLILNFRLLAKERESTSYDHETKELLGEAKEYLNNVKTTIMTSTAIGNVHILHAYLANI